MSGQTWFPGRDFMVALFHGSFPDWYMGRLGLLIPTCSLPPDSHLISATLRNNPFTQRGELESSPQIYIIPHYIKWHWKTFSPLFSTISTERTLCVGRISSEINIYQAISYRDKVSAVALFFFFRPIQLFCADWREEVPDFLWKCLHHQNFSWLSPRTPLLSKIGTESFPCEYSQMYFNCFSKMELKANKRKICDIRGK